MVNGIIKTSDSNFDKIYAHYVNPEKIKLNKKQEELNERWLAAWSCLLSKKSATKTAKILIKTRGISRAQAFRDIRIAEKLFGNVFKADKNGRLSILYDYALEGYKLAMKSGDLKSAVAFHKQMLECSPVDKDIQFNPEKLEFRPLKITAPKIVIERILQQGEKGVHDFNKIVDVEAEIIEDE